MNYIIKEENNTLELTTNKKLINIILLSENINN